LIFVALRALGIAAVLLVAGPVSAAQRDVDEPQRSTTLAARGSVIAYSSWDQAIGAYRLRVAVGDKPPRDVPVAPRSVPFDVHVGRARGGRLVLVYSRCLHEPSPLPAVAPEQVWEAARGCSLRVAGLDGGERAIRGAGSGVLPGVSGATLTFVRFAAGRRPRVVVRGFDRAGPPIRVLRPGNGIPVDLDLLGRRLAITRRFQGHHEVQDSALEIVDLRSARRRLVRHLNGGGQTGHFITGASLLPHGGVAWAEICGGDPGGCPHTERLARWTPRAGLHSVEFDEGVEAFAATPYARWVLQGCFPGSYVDDDAPCFLTRL
jgi:hypothetical protein